MKKMKLSLKEKAIEKALTRGEYRAASQAEFQSIADAIARRKKDAVLNIRVNHQDLEGLKQKARHLGVPYQSFIAELLHHFVV
jgi:predicted DNA binding CopG/RHH family protein